jgi:putative membrane protein
MPTPMYEWLKALHVIAVISWMAGMFYLPRLLVYHCESESGSVQSETFKVMERRLLKAIMTPAMAATWLLGVGMIVLSGGAAFASGWSMWLKLVLVLVLSGLHGALTGHVRDFAADATVKPIESGANKDGVPPPKKTVRIDLPRQCASTAALRSSAIKAFVYAASVQRFAA